jgi:hypothetical protein
MLDDSSAWVVNARPLTPPQIPSRIEGIRRSPVVVAQNDGVSRWR